MYASTNSAKQHCVANKGKLLQSFLLSNKKLNLCSIGAQSRFCLILFFVPFHPTFPPPTINLPAAHCSSSAPFSQSRSPSHRHDNETHLLAAPPQSNFSGGQVCRPVRRVEVKNSEGESKEGGERESKMDRVDEGVGGKWMEENESKEGQRGKTGREK